jgi:EAL domain-containing protein (putative c-di-GMP-specific phosphodiesterase class I)
MIVHSEPTRAVEFRRAAMTPEGAGEIRVLLVDDDELVRRNYVRLARRLGYVPETAEDGRAAIAKLKVRAFDLVLSDINMPGMSGIEFLRVVREHDLDVPVILITGQPDLKTAVEAVEYGAFRYLTKPVDVDVLTQVIQRALHMHQLAKLKRAALDVVGVQGMKLGDRAALEARFGSGLSGLTMAFQPIVSWSRREVFGYEALVRSSEPSMKSPLELFDAAERLGRLHQLGRTIRAAVAARAEEAPPAAQLFVNLHAADLEDPELYSEQAPLAAIASRVILELTERVSLEGVQGLAGRVARLRDLGYRIAVDDLGAGYAGLSSLTQLDPELVKLDRSLVQDIHISPRKRSIVEAMMRLCRGQLGIEVIAEGIELAEERDVLAAAGCDLLQGYHFARPERGFARPFAGTQAVPADR